MDDFKELTPEEKKAFEQLSRSQIPPASLEDKIVKELKINNLIMKTSWIKSKSVKLIGGIAAVLFIRIRFHQ